MRSQHLRVPGWLAVCCVGMVMAAACGTLSDPPVAAGGDGTRLGPGAGGEGVGDEPASGDLDGGSVDPGSPEAGSTEAGGATGGDATGGDQAPGSASGPLSQGVSDTQIKIGMSLPLSGLAGDLLGEEALGAAEAYFDAINAKGGINGRKVKLIAYDDPNLDLTQQLLNFRKLWEQDKVAAIFTAIPAGVGNYVTEKKIPTFVLGFSSDSFTSKYPTIFPILQSSQSAVYSFVAGLKQLGVTKPGMRVGIISMSEIVPVSPYLPYAEEAWREIAGAEVVAKEVFNLTQGDCTPVMNKMKSLNVDWIDFQTLAWSLCVSAAARIGYKPNIGWGDWPTNVPFLAQNAGPAVEGVWFMAPADEPGGYPRSNAPTPALQEYRTTLETYKPVAAEPIHISSVFTQTYYMAAQVLGAALKAQGENITQAGLLRWLQVDSEGYDMGIAPPLASWKPNCKVGVNTIWIGQWTWKDGAPVRVGRTSYIDNPYAVDKYGPCYVTEIADKIEG